MYFILIYVIHITLTNNVIDYVCIFEMSNPGKANSSVS